MPSSSAACAAALASSSRALRSFISVSVAAPTLIWATPPASLASRSCSFSRSYSLSVVSISRRICSARPSMPPSLPAAADDRGVLAVDRDLLGLAEVGELDAVELDAQVLEDRGAAGEDGDVAEHRLAAVAVAGGLHGTDLQDAAELVDDQRRQGFAFDIFGDDQQRLVGLADRFEQRDQLLGVRDLFFVDQDVGSSRARPSASSWLVTKCGERIAAVELHAFDDVDGRLDCCGLLRP